MWNHASSFRIVIHQVAICSQLGRSLTCGRRWVRRVLHETVDGGQVAIDGGAFLVAKGNLLEVPQDVVLGVEKPCERGLPEPMEAAPSAGHAVGALFEDLAGAPAMAEVAAAPGPSVGDRLFQGVLVDQHFDRAQVASEVSGVGASLGVSMAKNRSTRFAQEELVGMKCRKTRFLRSIQASTFSCLCVA